MKALILGIGGQDGSYLAEILLERDYEVHGLYRRSSVNNLTRIAHVRDKVVLHQGDITDPPSILGCKTATTAEPPEQSDLIPGWATGLSRTEANRAYNQTAANAPPSFEVTGAGTISLTREAYIYGMIFQNATGSSMFQAEDSMITAEECEFISAHAGRSDWAGGLTIKNCSIQRNL